MKKVYLSIIGFSILCRLSAYSQTRVDTAGNKPAFSLNSPVAYDTTDYRPRALRLDEINFVSSYYNQTGNHSAITAGIGTENVTDLSNGLELKFVWLGDNSNKNTLTTGFGYDHHTSASAAWLYQSGKGKTGGDRIYPSIDWTIENAKTGNTFGIGSYYSEEYNYRSFGADVHFR